MTREQEYDVAYAKSMAAADCASVVSVEVLGLCVPAGIKDKEAYRNEVVWIADDLTQRAIQADFDAEILRPGFAPDLP
jgi:hypothetical protein